MKRKCNPWRWQLEAETCRGNLMNTIKTAYNALDDLLGIFHLIKKIIGTTVNRKTQYFGRR
jgi:hypothetical protein